MAEPTPSHQIQLRQLIGEVRRTFRLLAAMSDDMLRERQLTASLRAVLEYLVENGPTPVPEIARAKRMTRQSMQALVDRLGELGLVTTEANPSHQRSVLIVPTEKGIETFGDILKEEAILLQGLASELTGADIEQAAGTLAQFRLQLETARSTHDDPDF